MYKSLFCVLSVFTAIVSSAPSTTHQLVPRAPAKVYTKCVKSNTVALTFDDGPWIYLYDVGKAIAAVGGKATFFFNGNNFGCIYDEDQAKRVKWAYDKGHQVASHSWNHINLTAPTQTWDSLHHQFWLMEDALSKITGATPAVMRPPYGAYNDQVREVAGTRGQAIVNWDFDSGDTWAIGTPAVMERYTNISIARPNTILALNHDVHQQTAQVVIPHAIKVLSAKGYKFVTVSECLGIPAYQKVTAPKTLDASWTCVGKPLQLQLQLSNTTDPHTVV